MSKLRSLNTAFWSDPFIEELKPDEKLLFLYLITNEKTNMLGIYESSVRKISFETGIDTKRVETILKRFESIGKIKYMDNWVMLVNFMKHQNYNPNMKKSAIDCYYNLPENMKIKGLNLNRETPVESFETLSKAFGMVRKVEVEYEVEIETELEAEEEKKEGVFVFENTKPKKRETEFKPPTLEEFINYAQERLVEIGKNNPENYIPEITLKFHAWNESGWQKEKDGNLVPILNWKSTLNNTLGYFKGNKQSPPNSAPPPRTDAMAKNMKLAQEMGMFDGKTTYEPYNEQNTIND